MMDASNKGVELPMETSDLRSLIRLSMMRFMENWQMAHLSRSAM